MAVDTADETMPGASDTAVHRVVALMHEKLHVLATNDVGGLDATVTLRGRRYHGKQCAALIGNGGDANEKKRQEYANVFALVRHSPMPMSM
jgi:hypothetical protein